MTPAELERNRGVDRKASWHPGPTAGNKDFRAGRSRVIGKRHAERGARLLGCHAEGQRPSIGIIGPAIGCPAQADGSSGAFDRWSHPVILSPIRGVCKCQACLTDPPAGGPDRSVIKARDEMASPGFAGFIRWPQRAEMIGTQCAHCGGGISAFPRACPHCGAPGGRVTSMMIAGALGLLLAAVVIAAVVVLGWHRLAAATETGAPADEQIPAGAGSDLSWLENAMSECDDAAK